MADFPPLTPSSRVFTSPKRVVDLSESAIGERFALQKSNAFVGGQLALSFIALPDSDVVDILGHNRYHGDFYPFDLPSAITAGSTIYQPAGHKWIYLEPASVTRAGGLNDIEVSLALVPNADF
tara:strand:+ start:250 stop:618 length:369 start_codon:yes stop_codon:yes gene_type:complete